MEKVSQFETFRGSGLNRRDRLTVTMPVLLQYRPILYGEAPVSSKFNITFKIISLSSSVANLYYYDN